MRLFYALVPSEREKRSILRWQEKLEKVSEAGRYTPTENLHMTLQFLGEIQQEQVKTLKEILLSAARTCGPFDLALDDYGWFAGKGQERLWYLTGSSPEATQLSHALEQLLLESGFAVENRVFLPHVTLARRCKLRSNAVPEPADPVTVSVQRLWLMESRQIRGSTVYVPAFYAGLA